MLLQKHRSSITQDVIFFFQQLRADMPLQQDLFSVASRFNDETFCTNNSVATFCTNNR